MAYINLPSATKLARSNLINTAIGTSGLLSIYTGSIPINPDLTATGTLLVTLPLSATAGVATLGLNSAAIVNVGSGGTNGAVVLTGTTGTGTKFTVNATIAGGALSAIGTVVTTGSYTVAPANLNLEPVTGGGLTGATLKLDMTGILTFNAITQTNAAATGTAGYGRITTSGGVGVVDMDCGTSATSLILNTVSLTLGGPVVVTSAVLQES